MNTFYSNIKDKLANELQQASKLHYELRENLNTLLNRYGVNAPAEILAQIKTGTLDEHPAYEDYLSAHILDETRQNARELMLQLTQQANRS